MPPRVRPRAANAAKRQSTRQGPAHDRRRSRKVHGSRRIDGCVRGKEFDDVEAGDEIERDVDEEQAEVRAIERRKRRPARREREADERADGRQ